MVAWWHYGKARPALRFSDLRLLVPRYRPTATTRATTDLRLYFLRRCVWCWALAGPRLAQPTPITTTEGISLVLVVDVSGSMHEVDADWGGQRISRLDAATRVFELFVLGGVAPGGQTLQGRPQDLIALVTFASYPEPVAPLTLSHSVLLQLLRAEQSRRPDEGQTNIGDALAESLLRSSRLRTSKVIVL